VVYPVDNVIQPLNNQGQDETLSRIYSFAKFESKQNFIFSSDNYLREKKLLLFIFAKLKFVFKISN